tara:strand:- start:502 stop:621 length:120 start_codon:yes stop_codon:yes gene_type:complete
LATTVVTAMAVETQQARAVLVLLAQQVQRQIALQLAVHT